MSDNIGGQDTRESIVAVQKDRDGSTYGIQNDKRPRP